MTRSNFGKLVEECCAEQEKLIITCVCMSTLHLMHYTLLVTYFKTLKLCALNIWSCYSLNNWFLLSYTPTAMEIKHTLLMVLSSLN